ncbi:MAG: hypothetical protein ABL893_08455, partial [Hyphomicrobium sp.]
MPDFTVFNAAHLIYLRGLDPNQGTEGLAKHVTDGTSHKAPVEWVGTLHWLSQRGVDPTIIAGLAKSFVVAVARNPAFDEALATALVDLFSWVESPVLDDLVASLLPAVGPGEAGIVADLLQRHQMQLDRLAGSLRPLGEWLLTTGAAELRDPARHDLLVRLLLTVEAAAALASALDLVLLSERSVPRGDFLHPRGMAVWARLDRFE